MRMWTAEMLQLPRCLISDSCSTGAIDALLLLLQIKQPVVASFLSFYLARDPAPQLILFEPTYLQKAYPNSSENFLHQERRRFLFCVGKGAVRSLQLHTFLVCSALFLF